MSTTSGNRRVAAYARISDNPEVDAVDDRLTRNAAEKEGFIAVCARFGVQVHTIAEGITDPKTSGGRLMARVTGAFAEYESDIRRERVLASVIRRLLDGEEIDGHRAFGWTDGTKQILDPFEAELVRWAFERVLKGGSVNGITKRLNEENVPTVGSAAKWAGTQTRMMLRRTRNAGFTVVDGVEYPLKIAPLVDRETFDAVQAILDGNKVGRREYGRKPAHMLTGSLVKCGTCGADARYKRTVKTTGKVYEVYCCKAVQGHASFEATELERRVTALMAWYFIRNRQRPREDDSEVRTLVAQRAELIRRRTVQQSLLEEPGIDLRQALARVRELSAEIDDVDRRITSAHQSGNAAVLDIVDRALGDGTTEGFSDALHPFQEAVHALPIHEQRALVRFAFESITMTGRTWTYRLHGQDDIDQRLTDVGNVASPPTLATPRSRD